jgi:hypothetical protein
MNWLDLVSFQIRGGQQHKAMEFALLVPLLGYVNFYYLWEDLGWLLSSRVVVDKSNLLKRSHHAQDLTAE